MESDTPNDSAKRAPHPEDPSVTDGSPVAAPDVAQLDPDAPGSALFREDEDAIEPNEPG